MGLMVRRQKVKRPCLNELQEEYCVKIKLISLATDTDTDVLMPKNLKLLSSPTMLKIKGKTK